MSRLIRAILTKTAWWAPVAVLLLHKVVMWLGLRSRTDGLLHFAGGLAVTFFIWTLIPVVERWLGTLSISWRFLMTFCAGCTVALGWDLAEFGSDALLGTDIQHSLRETMLDLVYGAAGVVVMIAVLLSIVLARGGRSTGLRSTGNV